MRSIRRSSSRKVGRDGICYTIRIGDVVFMREYESGWKAYSVIGFGEGVVNGSDMTGVPYVKRYDHGGDYSWNCNNYVRGDAAYIMPRE